MDLHQVNLIAIQQFKRGFHPFDARLTFLTIHLGRDKHLIPDTLLPHQASKHLLGVSVIWGGVYHAASQAVENSKRFSKPLHFRRSRGAAETNRADSHRRHLLTTRRNGCLEQTSGREFLTGQ